MGLGLTILAYSRPFEGFVFSLPVAVVVAAWLLGKKSPKLQVTLRRVVLPLILVLSLAAIFLGYYLWRVTGSPFRMPYQIERQTYAVAPYMLWQHERPEPQYRNPVIRKMYVEEELLGYRFFRSFPGLLLKVYIGWTFFFGPLLTFPLLMLAMTLPRGFSLRSISGKSWILLYLLVACVISWIVESFYNPHYSAPATGLFLLLVLISIQRLRSWNAQGLSLSRAIVVICALSFAIRIFAQPLRIPVRKSFEPAWHEAPLPDFGRASIQRKLMQTPGEHLVFVRYAPDHEPFAEWVYNDADLDRAKVVWARDMGIAENQRLLSYFKDRQAWLLEADENPPKPTSYQSNVAGIPR
jgi:hypothetical protein